MQKRDVAVIKKLWPLIYSFILAVFFMPSARADAPQWVKDIKISGDFRSRYQWDKSKNATSTANVRNRERIRARLGAETKIVEDLGVGVGVATGATSNPKTNNITVGEGYSGTDIILDYAYGRYTPKWTAPVDTAFTAGRFKNPFWEPINALVDPDIKLGGTALQFSYAMNPSANIFLNYGFIYIGDTFPRSRDSLANVVQPGLNWKINDSIKIRSTVDFWLAGTKGNKQIHRSPGTNTLVRDAGQGPASDRVYQNNYYDVIPKMEIRFPYFSVFGEYIDNLSPAAKNTGWIAGCKIGDETVSDKFQWQLLYDHRFLEKDSFLDAFTDDDFYGGRLPSEGEEVAFNFGLSKNSWVTLKYYNTRSTTRVSNDPGSSKLGSQTIMADWNIKF